MLEKIIKRINEKKKEKKVLIEYVNTFNSIELVKELFKDDDRFKNIRKRDA